MSDNFHKEIPQQRALGKSVDPEKMLEKAAGLLNCDLDCIRNNRRIPKSIKENRDLLVYLVWKTCMLTNEETLTLVWHDLFGGKPHSKFHANRNAKRF